MVEPADVVKILPLSRRMPCYTTRHWCMSSPLLYSRLKHPQHAAEVMEVSPMIAHYLGLGTGAR